MTMPASAPSGGACDAFCWWRVSHGRQDGRDLRLPGSRDPGNALRTFRNASIVGDVTRAWRRCQALVSFLPRPFRPQVVLL
jgi:hypothetical protein